MINHKHKVGDTAEHMKNAVIEALDRIGHAATQALHQGDQALSDLAH